MSCSKFLYLYLLLFLMKLCNGYDIPTPEIIAYTPRGLRVSIPHADEINLFAFHGNVNKQISILKHGQYGAEVNRESNGKWSVYHPQAKLNVGDTLHYWLLVLKDGSGFKRSFLPHKITELVDASVIENVTKPLSDNTSKTNNHCNADQSILCYQNIINITQSLARLQKELDTVENKNEQLTKYLENMPNAKKLTLSGRIPPDGDPASTVSFILREKVDMNPVIVSAQRNSDLGITFEVPTVSDKLDILEASEREVGEYKNFDSLKYLREVLRFLHFFPDFA